MAKPKNVYIHKGTPGCKGQTSTEHVTYEGAAMLHLTCAGCPLDWYTADNTASAVGGSRT